MINIWGEKHAGVVWGIFRFASENMRALGLQNCKFKSDIRNCYSPDVSASSVPVYQVIHCTGIGKFLITCNQVFCTLLFYVWFRVSFSDNGKGLISSASLSLAETDVFCQNYAHMCHSSVSVRSSTAESLSTVFHVGQMENDVNPHFLS